MDWLNDLEGISRRVSIAGFLAALVPSIGGKRFLWRPAIPLGFADRERRCWSGYRNALLGVLGGNIPLASLLWANGISFGGVISFIYADLLVIPLILIYRKYFGGRDDLHRRNLLRFDGRGWNYCRSYLRFFGPNSHGERPRAHRTRDVQLELHNLAGLCGDRAGHLALGCENAQTAHRLREFWLCNSDPKPKISSPSNQSTHRRLMFTRIVLVTVCVCFIAPLAFGQMRYSRSSRRRHRHRPHRRHLPRRPNREWLQCRKPIKGRFLFPRKKPDQCRLNHQRLSQE